MTEQSSPEVVLLEKYRAALQAIVDFELHPHAESDPAAIKESDECAECKKAEERRWPPSGLCNDHYGKIVSERERRQAHLDVLVKYQLRDIAKEALR